MKDWLVSIPEIEKYIEDILPLKMKQDPDNKVYKEILDKGYTSSYQYVCKIIKDFGKII